MSDNNSQPGEPKLCYECNQMYGNIAFKDMCSLCYKKSLEVVDKKVQMILRRKATQPAALKHEIEGPKSEDARNSSRIPQSAEKIGLPQQNNVKCPNDKQIQKPIQKIAKCGACSKKVGLLGYSCSHCEVKYCKMHRLPEDHECKADFITLGRKKLKMENPILQDQKIEKI